MSCSIEVLKSYSVSNPTAARTNVPVNADDNYRILTVYNTTDQDILIDYKTQEGYGGSFTLPRGGNTFTRVINGTLLYNSLFVTAIGSTATGNVYFNLGN